MQKNRRNFITLIGKFVETFSFRNFNNQRFRRFFGILFRCFTMAFFSSYKIMYFAHFSYFGRILLVKIFERCWIWVPQCNYSFCVKLCIELRTEYGEVKKCRSVRQLVRQCVRLCNSQADNKRGQYIIACLADTRAIWPRSVGLWPPFESIPFDASSIRPTWPTGTPPPPLHPLRHSEGGRESTQFD